MSAVPVAVRRIRRSVSAKEIRSRSAAADAFAISAQIAWCTIRYVPRATLYRSYPHLKAEFERARSDAQTAGLQPDPRLAQIERLKTEIIDLHNRLNRGNAEVAELREFRAAALSRLSAQHDEVISLRRELATAAAANVRGLTSRQQG